MTAFATTVIGIGIRDLSEPFERDASEYFFARSEEGLLCLRIRRDNYSKRDL